jgi:hypothetical protein
MLTGQLSAKCGPGQLNAWPNGSTLSQNGFIVVDGSGVYEDVILNLGTKFPIYLRSGETIIALTVQDIHKGQYRQSQAILVPKSALLVGQVYELVVDSLPYGRTIKRKSGETVQWTISALKDTKFPEIKGKPVLKSKTYQRYGCGPESFLTYQFKGSDNDEFLITVTIKSSKTNKETKYYLPHDKQMFILGHDMCYGEFSFERGQDYEMTVGLIDSNGNAVYWPDKINFQGPTFIN